ncbi:unnamed protein product [Urochloa humidicola]
MPELTRASLETNVQLVPQHADARAAPAPRQIWAAANGPNHAAASVGSGDLPFRRHARRIGFGEGEEKRRERKTRGKRSRRTRGQHLHLPRLGRLPRKVAHLRPPRPGVLQHSASADPEAAHLRPRRQCGLAGAALPHGGGHLPPAMHPPSPAAAIFRSYLGKEREKNRERDNGQRGGFRRARG